MFSIIVEKPGKMGMGLKIAFGFLFGQAGVAFILIIIFIAISIIINGQPFHWNRKILALIIIGFNYSILTYVFIVNDLLPDSLDIKSIFYIAWGNATQNIGGGFIGLTLSYILESLLSKTGTIIVLILSTLIAFMLFTQKSIITFLKKVLNNIKSWIINFKEDLFSPDGEKEAAIHSVSDLNIPQDNEYREIKRKTEKTDEKIKILDFAENRNSIGTKSDNKSNDQDYSDEEILTKNLYLSKPKLSKYTFPPIELLNKPNVERTSTSKKKVINNAKILENTLLNFGVQAKVVQVNMGPTITRYELQPNPGVKVSKIVSLTDDIALNLATSGVRVEAPIPGKAAIGIEVPNPDPSLVYIRELLEDDHYQNFPSDLAFGVGKDISGKVKVSDIGKMPHLLIAGATGAGKSVCINSLITSILYKSTPDQVRLILIDPKVVELNVYNGIPHLLIPVVTDPKKASGALNWAVKEMTDRYKKFAQHSVRDIEGYNNLFHKEPEEKMAKIIVIIDELADLMLSLIHISLFFTEIANNNISIDLINLFPEEKVFIIDKKDISKVEEILKENKYQYNIIDNCCKVTAIGSGMRGVPGVMARIVSALHREDIQILQTADSHTTISCLVKEEDTKAAIRVLHEEFNLG